MTMPDYSVIDITIARVAVHRRHTQEFCVSHLSPNILSRHGTESQWQIDGRDKNSKINDQLISQQMRSVTTPE